MNHEIESNQMITAFSCGESLRGSKENEMWAQIVYLTCLDISEVFYSFFHFSLSLSFVILKNLGPVASFELCANLNMTKIEQEACEFH